MATTSAVWGIDIGQCGLKALRCSLSDDGTHLVADAFDFIEYPQIVTQPDADRDALIHDALELFLSRHDVRDDKVAVSVPGQSGLARFIKLPPVESKKVPDIVSYEARQQIPFPLDEVVWDYQKMPGSNEEEGGSLQRDIGLFAMKRDQVFRWIKPFEKAGIELDLIQLSPLTLYNFATYEKLMDVPSPEEYDPENPPESIVILSLGTESTDLVITDGYQVWQRNIPLGGNHFTKQLMKDRKLTFAKAEHLKRNVREAQDAKPLFQAMRPVFNDLVTEVQRSIGFFENIHRDAKIGRLLALGNAMKLPGLLQYLERNLGYPSTLLEVFGRLKGPAVVSAPSFTDNSMSFAVSYGLVLQGLGQSAIQTNLLPHEIITRRLIRQKKPWAVFIVALLLAGCLFNFFFHWNAWSQVHPEQYAVAFNKSENVSSQSASQKSRDAERIEQFKRIKSLGEVVVGNSEGRLLCLELFRAVFEALPRDPTLKEGQISDKPLDERPNLYVEYVDSVYLPDLSQWWNDSVKTLYLEGGAKDAEDVQAVEESPESEPADQMPAPQPQVAADVDPSGPSGPGWVIEIGGFHYFNKDPQNEAAQYVRNTLLQQLEHGQIMLPDGPNIQLIPVSMDELGVAYPILIRSEGRLDRSFQVPNPKFDPDLQRHKGRLIDESAQEDEAGEPPFHIVPRYQFVVQFCWKETKVTERQEKRQLEKQEKEQLAERETAGQREGF